MITINSNKEAQVLIHNDVLAVDDDLEIAFDGFYIDADIKCKNIYSKDSRRDITAWNLNVRNINAYDLNVWNIDARNLDVNDINAGNLNVRNIDARTLDVRNINALDLNVWNIDARNLDVGNIKAKDISYYAVCFAYDNINCTSIKGIYKNARHFCLNGEITIRGEEQNKESDYDKN